MSPEVLGRGTELARLQDYYAAALRGNAPIVMIEGEAGTGKTHLLRLFAAWAERQGARVLSVTCYEVETQVPYGSLIRTLQAFLSDNGLTWDPSIAALLGLPHQVPTLMRLMSFWTWDLERIGGETRAVPAPPVRPAQSAQVLFHPGQVREEMIQLFKALAKHTPLVIILDDLHWADTATLELWSAAYRQLRGLPVLILGSYCPEEVDQAHPLYRLNFRLSRLVPFVYEGGETGGPETFLVRIRLRPLEKEAIQRLVAAFAPDKEIPKDWIEKRRQYGDEPLAFWTAWARWIASSDSLDLASANLDELHKRLIEVLDPAARSILEAAAVLGSEAEGELLAFVAGLSDEEAARALRRLADDGLLDDRSGKYKIANTLLIRTIYEGLSEGRRNELHRRVGQGLEHFYPYRLNAMAAVLARHYKAAGELNLALRYLMKAGAWAYRLAALKEAGELYWDALSLAVLAGDAHAQVLIHEALGDIHMQMGDHRAAQGHFHAALGGAHSASQQALIRVRMARSLGATGQYEQARTALRQALQALIGEHNLQAQGIVWLHLAWIEELLGNRVAALFAANHARAAAIQTDDPALKADAALALALLYWHQPAVKAQRDLEQARELCRLSIQIREQMGDVAGCARAWAYLGMIERDQGHLSAACQCFAKSAEAYRQIGDWLSEATIRARWGEASAAAGNLIESVTQFRRAFELHRELQNVDNAFDPPLWTHPLFNGEP
ncbi:MAG: AAA family ATPase [Anaerolineae bacterium]|nr:AAA family ATPase [Anaerolineae bacterium]